MATSYRKGHEPRCPVQLPGCEGRIRTKGYDRCRRCARQQRDAPRVSDDTLPSTRPVESITESDASREITKVTSERVRSLEDMIRVCAIDTATWEIERWVANKWEMGSVEKSIRYDKTTGAKHETASATTTPLYQVKVWLKRKVATLAVRDELAALKADAKRTLPKPATIKPQRQGKGLMLELSIPDLHVGKLAWAKETGYENYDGKIAERVFEDALAALLERTASYRFEEIVFVVGNDLLHADTKQGTTNSGTQLDNDSRYHKTFSIVRHMITRAIDRLRAVAPVHVVMVPGNHDTLSVWHLGDSLECYYRNTSGVVIDNDPRMRKYKQFGQVMLMFTHGHQGKLEKYPQLMASEQREMWGATIHREAHTGDKHQLKVQEHFGVKVRISPALCPPDAWHSENQFVGQGRSAEAFVWHREEGLVGTAYYTVPAPKRKGAA
jgi:hypothetical protein